MGTVRTNEPPTRKPAQTLLALAMLFQVKDKISRENWMVAREVIAANQEIFSRIRKAIERDYDFEVETAHLLDAVVMLLKGMKIDVVPRR